MRTAAPGAGAQRLEPADAGPEDAGARGEGPDAGPAAGDDAGIDLSQYGLDPDYRPPAPTPVTVSAVERRVLDEIDRLTQVFAQDLAPEALYARLGRPTGMSRSTGRMAVDPSSPDLAVIHVALGVGVQEELELRLFAPITPAVLATRVGPFEPYWPTHFGEPKYYASAFREQGGPYEIAVVVEYAWPPVKPAEEPTRVVLVHRRRKR